MVDANLVGYKIKSIDMVNNIQSNGSLKIENTFDFSVMFSQDRNFAIAELIEYIQLSEHPEQFHITLSVEGSFALKGVNDNDCKKKAHMMCYDQLFPYASQIISQLSMNSGMSGMVLKKIPMDEHSVQFNSPNSNEEKSKTIEFPTNVD